ncbi:putative Flp pilus-assembly TadE/G-like protein [Mumia flava]|uniref:Putative Flp pilus-assembly TadE/G-like protein n=1 Tax=Mumia flava TaxID=1348852 RepID=A0A2M9B6J8_9ACTN|nr:pilus assembly protein TadG-related protein [Mumia flava]PJJ53570.1 putative Flp pilus-assembly TadE/G-like protein [Mumia flava]
MIVPLGRSLRASPSALRVRLAARGESERGSAAVFVVGMSIVLLVAAGLAIDGGLALNARMRVADDAEQAARVGADSLDIDRLRADGTIVIDVGLARQRAASYLTQRGYAPGQYAVSVAPAGAEVEVSVEDTTDTALLGLVNIDTFDVRAAASAEPATGPD